MLAHLTPAIDRVKSSWVRLPPPIDLMVVAVVTMVWRAGFLGFSRAPLLFPDSGKYLYGISDPAPWWDRPPGVSVVWRAAVEPVNSPLSILVMHALLGALTASLVYAGARLLGIPRPWSVLVAIATGLAPSHLFFERLLMAETLSSLLLMVVSVLLLACLRRPRWWWWVALGSALGASVLVRLQFATLAVAACVAIVVLWWEARLRARVVGVALVGATALVPVLLYASALGTAERDHRPDAPNALAYMSGQNLLTKVAPFMDCPGDYSEQRFADRLCTEGSGYLGFANGMLWAEGPVTEARSTLGPSAVDDMAMSVAREVIADHPEKYVRQVAVALIDSLLVVDDDQPYAFYDDPEDSGSFRVVWEAYAHQFGGAPDDYPAPSWDEVGFWYAVDTRWNYVRIAAWLGVAAAGVLSAQRWFRHVPGRGGVRVLTGTFALALLGVAMTTQVIVPRYWYPFENLAWLLTGWGVWVAVRARSRDRVPCEPSGTNRTRSSLSMTSTSTDLLPAGRLHVS